MPVFKAQASRIYTYHLGIAAQLLLLLMWRAHLGPKQEFLSFFLFPSTVYHRDVRNTRLYYSLTHRCTPGGCSGSFEGKFPLPPGSPALGQLPAAKSSQVKRMSPSRGGKRLDFPQNGRGKRLGVRLSGVGRPGRATPGGQRGFNGITTATRFPIKSC